jgi:hypothetical protein
MQFLRVSFLAIAHLNTDHIDDVDLCRDTLATSKSTIMF